MKQVNVQFGTESVVEVQKGEKAVKLDIAVWFPLPPKVEPKEISSALLLVLHRIDDLIVRSGKDKFLMLPLKSFYTTNITVSDEVKE